MTLAATGKTGFSLAAVPQDLMVEGACAQAEFMPLPSLARHLPWPLQVTCLNCPAGDICILR